MARYRLTIGSLIGALVLFLYGRSRYRRHVATKARVPGLVNMVLSRLAVQRDLGDEGVDDAFLFQPHLRDDVLREIHSLKEREHIWARVRAVVEQNANVRIAQREGRNGEIGRAWEWIGPTADRSGVLHRRRSGRVLFGPHAGGKDEMNAGEANGEVEGQELPRTSVKQDMEQREREPERPRWQERQRPVY